MRHGALLIIIISISLHGIQAEDPYTHPPTDLSLLQAEQQEENQQYLSKIAEVVEHAIKENVPRKRKKGSQKKRIKKHSARHKIPRNLTKHHSDREAVEQELYESERFLDHVYNDPELTEKTISISLRKTSIKDALSLISTTTGISYALDADVSGTISSLDVRNVSLATALRLLLASTVPRLALIKQAQVWRIINKKTALQEIRHMIIDQQLHDTIAQHALIRHLPWDEQLKKRLEKLWEGISGATAKDKSSYLIFDDAGKKIFLRGRTHHVHDFIKHLELMDVRIPQVRIDARIVLAEKDFEEILGFNWSGIYNRRASLRALQFSGAGVGSLNSPTPEVDTQFSSLFPWALNLIPGTSLLKAASINLPITFANRKESVKRLNLTLQAAEQRQEIKTILKPSLLVRHEETADILVGQELPQEVRLQETIEGKLTNVSSISYKDIGMKIKVKPTVSPDQAMIFLDIFFENSQIGPSQIPQNATVNNADLQAQFTYTVQTSRSHNRALLENGQTTLISGLKIKTLDRVKTGVPVLQDIPVIGFFFRGKRKTQIEKELLIFITPTLI